MHLWFPPPNASQTKILSSAVFSLNTFSMADLISLPAGLQSSSGQNAIPQVPGSIPFAQGSCANSSNCLNHPVLSRLPWHFSICSNLSFICVSPSAFPCVSPFRLSYMEKPSSRDVWDRRLLFLCLLTYLNSINYNIGKYPVQGISLPFLFLFENFVYHYARCHWGIEGIQTALHGNFNQAAGFFHTCPDTPCDSLPITKAVFL